MNRDKSQYNLPDLDSDLIYTPMTPCGELGVVAVNRPLTMFIMYSNITFTGKYGRHMNHPYFYAPHSFSETRGWGYCLIYAAVPAINLFGMKIKSLW
jgi:hypothetical protein